MIHGQDKKKKKHPGTYDRIISIVSKIPCGKIATYGQVAQLAGLEGQSRLAGYALHHIPPEANIPWHRVINARGMISFPKNDDTYRQQKKLLIREGIRFNGEKIDLELYRWKRKTRKSRLI